MAVGPSSKSSTFEPDDLGYSRAGVVHGSKHDCVAVATPGIAIRSTKDGVDFFTGEIGNGYAIKALHGDGEGMAN